MEYVNHMEKLVEFSSQRLVWTSLLARGHNIFLLHYRREIMEGGEIKVFRLVCGEWFLSYPQPKIFQFLNL